MKRIYSLAAAVLAAAILSFQLSAQTASDLVGKWLTNESENDDDIEMNMDITTVFGADGTITQSGFCSLLLKFDAETQFPYDLTFSGSGTYELDGDILKLNHDPKKFEMKEAKSNMPGILKMLLLNPLKSEIKKSMKKPETYRIVSYNGKELRLLDLDSKDAEEDLYKRIN